MAFRYQIFLYPRDFASSSFRVILWQGPPSKSLFVSSFLFCILVLIVLLVFLFETDVFDSEVPSAVGTTIIFTTYDHLQNC